MQDPRFASKRFISRFALLCVAVGFSPGCGAKSDLPPVVPVSGQVLFEGEPLAGATVNFLGDGKIRPAYATTESDGRFRLTTFTQHDGAIPGTHAVTVSKFDVPPGGADDGSMESAVKRANKPAPVPKSLIPARYGDATRSNLQFKVEPNGTHDFKIELKK